MEVCPSSYRQNLFLDPIALHFLNLETSATRLARVLLGIKVSKVVPIHRLANQNHIMILAVLKHVEATKQLQPCLEVY